MVAHVKSLVLSIAIILPILAESTVVAAQTAGSGSNTAVVNNANVKEAKAVVSTEDDASRYLNAVIEFADNVLKYGKDTYGPKHTPLFVDGLMVRDPNDPNYGKDGVFKPVEWIAPNGDRWILSNLVSQQNLFRTLDALTTITGDPKYKQAAMDAIRYAFDNLRSPNGLLYWGGHAAYDLGADKPCGTGIHELKGIYPYYELMWEVDPQATKEFIEAFWSGHVLDWSNLDMNRHSWLVGELSEKPWVHEYKNGPVFFMSKVSSASPFLATGSDLFYSGSALFMLRGQRESLVWAERLAHRYVETRHPNTGMSSNIYTTNPYNAMLYQFGDNFKMNFEDPRTRLFPHYPSTFGEINALTLTQIRAWICSLLIGDTLGHNGEKFTQWALEELTAWGKSAYRKEDNAFIPMLTDGTSLEGYVLRKDGYYGAEGTVLKVRHAGPLELWAYTIAYCLSGDEFAWEIARNIAKGNNLGDLGTDNFCNPRLNMETTCSNPLSLLAFLRLYKIKGNQTFLNMAKRMACSIFRIILARTRSGNRRLQRHVCPDSQRPRSRRECPAEPTANNPARTGPSIARDRHNRRGRIARPIIPSSLL